MQPYRTLLKANILPLISRFCGLLIHFEVAIMCNHLLFKKFKSPLLYVKKCRDSKHFQLVFGVKRLLEKLGNSAGCLIFKGLLTKATFWNTWGNGSVSIANGDWLHSEGLLLTVVMLQHLQHSWHLSDVRQTFLYISVSTFPEVFTSVFLY